MLLQLLLFLLLLMLLSSENFRASSFKYIPSNMIQETNDIKYRYFKDFLCKNEQFLKLYFPTGVS